MPELNPQDQPPYDATLFELQRLKRASNFAAAIKNLARFNMTKKDDPKDKWTMRGASYDLPDGRAVDVMRQGYFIKPENSTSAARISSPWVERSGIDGKRRRARVCRYLTLNVTEMLDTMIDSDDIDLELPEPSEKLLEYAAAWAKQSQLNNLEKMLNPDYRPFELIDGKSTSLVEVKLAQGPNWSTERESSLSNKDSKLSNLSVRRQAGEKPEQTRYTIDEHNSVMSLFDFIKAHKIQPTDLSENII